MQDPSQPRSRHNELRNKLLVISKPAVGAGGLLITIPGGLHSPDPLKSRPPASTVQGPSGGSGARWPGGQDLGGPSPRLDHLDSIWWARPTKLGPGQATWVRIISMIWANWVGQAHQVQMIQPGAANVISKPPQAGSLLITCLSQNMFVQTCSTCSTETAQQ